MTRTKIKGTGQRIFQSVDRWHVADFHFRSCHPAGWGCLGILRRLEENGELQPPTSGAGPVTKACPVLLCFRLWLSERELAMRHKMMCTLGQTAQVSPETRVLVVSAHSVSSSWYGGQVGFSQSGGCQRLLCALNWNSTFRTWHFPT